MKITEKIKKTLDILFSIEFFKAYITNHSVFNSYIIKNIIKENKIDSVSYLCTCNTATITRVLNNYLEDYSISSYKDGNGYYFKYVNIKNVFKPCGMKKEKNLLSFFPNSKLNNEEDKIIYDFNKKDFVSCPDYCKHHFTSDYFKTSFPEWVFSYLDLLPHNNFKMFLQDIILGEYENMENCPAGYINYIKEKKQKITKTSYNDYKLFCKYGEKYLLLREKISSCYWELRETIQNNNDIMDFIFVHYNDFCKILNNSCKKFDITLSILGVIRTIVDFYNKVQTNPFEERIINNSMSLDTIKTILDEYKDMKQNKLIADRQSSFLFLNNTIIKDNYIVIVPKDLNDLRKEGAEQHNCVGYYYNESIIRKENIIYFLREKNTPSKSLVTCRYNFEKQSTIEARTRFNGSITREQKEATDEIDILIHNAGY